MAYALQGARLTSKSYVACFGSFYGPQIVKSPAWKGPQIETRAFQLGPSAFGKVPFVQPNIDKYIGHTRALNAYMTDPERLSEWIKAYILPVAELDDRTGLPFPKAIANATAAAFRAITLPITRIAQVQATSVELPSSLAEELRNKGILEFGCVRDELENGEADYVVEVNRLTQGASNTVVRTPFVLKVWVDRYQKDKLPIREAALGAHYPYATKKHFELCPKPQELAVMAKKRSTSLLAKRKQPLSLAGR